jgi:hypothetical protein
MAIMARFREMGPTREEIMLGRGQKTQSPRSFAWNFRYGPNVRLPRFLFA